MKTYKIKSVLYCSISVVSIVLFSCKKDHFSNGTGGLANLLVECECDTIPPYTGGYSPTGTYPVMQDSLTYHTPKFNPNNDNEIIFLERRYYESYYGIYKFNLATNLKTPILEGIPIGPQITWNKKDWIIFQQNADLNLYKIKSNGDSLTQLTFQHEFFNPNWNFDGTKFVAYHKYANKTMVLDENANVLDTLEGWYGTGDWQHPQYIAGLPQSTHLVVMNVESKNIIREIQNQLPNTFSTLGWATDDKIIYGNSDGLFTYWINNGIKQKMRNFCNASFYGVMSRNSTSTKLVFVKAINTLVNIDGTDVLWQDTKLVIMNTDGSDEQEIIIPE